MTPPIWLDDIGRRVPTRPGDRCDREWPLYRHRLQHLVMAGWKPMKPMLIVNWCGHGQQCMPWPEREGYWTLVPIIGEAG